MTKGESVTGSFFTEEASRVASRLCDELGLTWVSVTPEWSDVPTRWEGVERSEWVKGEGGRVFYVAPVVKHSEGLRVEAVAVVVHGVGHEVTDIEAELPDLVEWVRYARRAYA